MLADDEIMRELRRVRAEILKRHGGDHEKLNAYYKSVRFPGFTYGVPGRTFRSVEELDDYRKERDREFLRKRAERGRSDDAAPSESC